MSFQYLSGTEIDEIVQAAISAQMSGNATRAILLAALNSGFALGLPDVGNPFLQLHSDLNNMNVVEGLADGSVPLRDWLGRAASLARQMGRNEANVFTKYEAQVNAKASGQHELPEPAALREVINNEDIIHQDDMVDFWFLSAGSLAGSSVVKLFVPRFESGVAVMENGRPRRSLGTGWLLTDQLVITNHHVVNARTQGETPAGNEDLALQGQHTTVMFDYNANDDAGVEVEASSLEAWDVALDYAVLRLKTPVARQPLQLDRQPIVFSEGIYVPVNIIQHPSGHPKKVAFRNNLLTGADQTTIRYFTDTLRGSSGAPVFSDSWQVIALHRGSKQVQDVSFQGRDVAVVNVGTQISAILSHLETHHNTLFQEI